MDKKRIGIYAATALAVFIAISAISMVATPRAYAQSVPSSNGSYGACWGYQVNQLAATGTMGQHASDPLGTGTPGSDTPRTGLGNLMGMFPDGFQGLINFLTGESCFQ